MSSNTFSDESTDAINVNDVSPSCMTWPLDEIGVIRFCVQSSIESVSRPSNILCQDVESSILSSSVGVSSMRFPRSL